MLKKLRVLSALCVFIPLVLFFMDFADALPRQLRHLAAIQMVPAILAANAAVVVFLALLTLLFGRIYCSVLCPLGIVQDVISRVASCCARRKHLFRMTRAKSALRWTALAVVTLGALSGFTITLSLLDPYSIFGRISVALFKPCYLGVNNLLERLFAFFGNHAFFYVGIDGNGAAATGVAALSLLCVGFLAWKHGRAYCNTLCPVGTALGFLSRFSLMKIRLDPLACNHCGRCERACKASCLDSRSRTVDYSRCVACMNCLGLCSRVAVRYALPAFSGRRPGQAGESAPAEQAHIHRRVFLLTALGAAAAAPLAAMAAQTPVPRPAPGKAPMRTIPIRPPGAGSAEAFQTRCTACHACVGKCPSHVLRPAVAEYGLKGFLQPLLDFKRGFCSYNCTFCLEICPNGALRSLTLEEKQMTQIGHVVFAREICVVHADNTNCGACAEHCPTQAVTMAPYKGGLTIPVINPDICVGCGGCEYICPTRPSKAIYVEGNAAHIRRGAIDALPKEEKKIDSFGF